jgi:hypothetical protein
MSESLRDRILAATTPEEVIRLAQEGADRYVYASPRTARRWRQAVKASLARIRDLAEALPKDSAVRP